MSTTSILDRERLRTLFDLRRRGDATVDGQVYLYTDDPYPGLQRLRETGPVHEGIVHELLGFDKPATFQALPEPDRPHFSVFDYETIDRVFRDEETYPSSPEPIDPLAGRGTASSMLNMNGRTHRRYRALVQPSFVPKKAEWWITRWIDETVNSLIDGFEADGHAELNVDFDAAIPTLTITGSFGMAIEDALAVREALSRNGYGAEAQTLAGFVMPIIEARREQPQDDLISILVEAEMTDEEGVSHRLSDEEILSFSHLLLAAGSGTTWKQLGILITALLTTPEALAAVREDRAMLRPAVEEVLRWCPTDPMFSRYCGADTELAGVKIPKGACVHLSLGAGNRDPMRWDDPDRFDVHRPLVPHVGLGAGPHLCLGQHVARAEMLTAVDALLTRLPNLRLDPDAEAPRFIGMYERGPTEINVVWD
jgi:cytochrome P450